jgi:uncharacterized SAM-binding protein YcdF (DUF218 family)
MFLFSYKKRHLYVLAILGLFLLASLVLPVRIAIAHLVAPQPQAIFLLGGGHRREVATALFAKNHPDLDIWISTGITPERSEFYFTREGVSMDRVHHDYRAIDTVTNFTTMVEVFAQRDIHHVFLLTSEFHMARSRVIATLVFGFNGIIVTPIPLPNERDSEAWWKIPRDIFRSVLWILTGEGGTSLYLSYNRICQDPGAFPCQ